MVQDRPRPPYQAHRSPQTLCRSCWRLGAFDNTISYSFYFNKWISLEFRIQCMGNLKCVACHESLVGVGGISNINSCWILSVSLFDEGRSPHVVILRKKKPESAQIAADHWDPRWSRAKRTFYGWVRVCLNEIHSLIPSEYRVVPLPSTTWARPKFRQNEEDSWGAGIDLEELGWMHLKTLGLRWRSSRYKAKVTKADFGQNKVD